MTNTTENIVTVPAPVASNVAFATSTLALQQLALSKASVCDNAREQVSVGKHNVDFTVRVQGSVNVGEDYEQTPTANIPILPTLALFIRYSGITGPKATELLIRAMNEATTTDQKLDGILAEEVTNIETIQENLKQQLKAKLKKVPCKGKVTTKLTATIV